jgi:ribose 5-phosphate isomerase A
VRTTDTGETYLTDNGNLILDAEVDSILDPAALDRDLLAIPGVLGTGLFVGMADAVVVQRGDAVEVLHRS